MHSRTAIVVDVVLVAIFALIGRASHSESLTPAGVFDTAWPFIAALIVGWVVMVVRRRPGLTVGAGVFLWIVTVVGGMALRFASGAGTATAFIVVATVVLGALLVGWRAVVGRRLDEVRPWQTTDAPIDDGQHGTAR